MSAAYDISASASTSSSSATGATEFGNQTHNTTQFITGGSNGISTATVMLIVGAIVALWFFFFRK